MPAIRPADLPRFRAGGWKDYAIVLVHGSDEGAVRELSAGLVRDAAGADADPMNTTVLDGEAVAGDPSRLADELLTFGMFGGKRIVHVRNAGKVPAAAVESAAGLIGRDAFLVLEAGELKAGTGLRAFVERNRTTAAVACYADAGRSLQTLVDETLGSHGLSITREAREMLVGVLGADRALSRSELDKLCLYARGKGQIDVDAVIDIVSDAGNHEVSTVIDLAFSGEIGAIETETNRLLSAGTTVSGLLAQSIGHALTLRKAIRAQATGQQPDMLMRQLRLHFSRENAFRKALSLWREDRLDKALALLAEATAETRRNARLADIVAIRALWSVARHARPAQRGVV